MVQATILCDALSNVDLRLEATDASICGVGFCHHTTDATSDPLHSKKVLVSDHLASMFILFSTNDSLIISIV